MWLDAHDLQDDEGRDYQHYDPVAPQVGPAVEKQHQVCNVFDDEQPCDAELDYHYRIGPESFDVEAGHDDQRYYRDDRRDPDYERVQPREAVLIKKLCLFKLHNQSTLRAHFFIDAVMRFFSAA